jgi:hypothetical protein
VQAASRAYVLAAAALAATSAVVALPAAPQPSQPPVRSIETRLVDAGSVLNIPVNLFDDILNIPSTEVQGFNVLGDSLLFSGDWWVPSATNLWGTDPGDLGHYMGLLDMLIPFKEISGLGQPEIDPTAMANGTAGLAQQIGLLAAAELPVSSSCDAQTCFPMTPPEVLTGSTAFDRLIGFDNAITGHATTAGGDPFGLFSNWFQVPLSTLTNGGFQFNSLTDSGIVDPSPNAATGGGVLGEFGFPGTVGTGDTAGNMPWAGDTFQLNLFGPFENFYNSLLATPSTSGIGGTGVEIPTATAIGQDFQTFAAGLVIAFDPYVEGSPACPAACDLPANETQLALVKDVLAWDPTNKDVATWVANYPDNNATLAESQASVALLQTGDYNLTAAQLAQYDADLNAINPELPALFTNGGIVTDPNYVAYSDALVNGTPLPAFDPVYGGYDPNLVGSDLLTLLTNNAWNFSSLSNINTVSFLLDPAQGDPGLGAAAVPAASAASELAGVNTLDPSLSTDLSSLDPSLSTDLSTLLASLGTTAGADALSQLSAEISAQLTADLATILPQSLVSLF